MRACLANAARSRASMRRSRRPAADGGTARNANRSHRPTSRRFLHAHHAAVTRPNGKSFHNHAIARNASFPERLASSTRLRTESEPIHDVSLDVVAGSGEMRAVDTDGRSSARRWTHVGDVDLSHHRGDRACGRPDRFQGRGARRQHREGRRRRPPTPARATSSSTPVPGSSAGRCSFPRRRWSASISTRRRSSSIGRRTRSRTLLSSIPSMGFDPRYQDELGGYYGQYYS